MPRLVHNEFPSIELEHRIAIIGEAPGMDEESIGKPFVGNSGRIINGLLQANGILRSSCFVGNICQVRPPNNEIYHFAYEGDEIQSGLRQLKADLTAYRPHCTLLLGATALKAAGITHSISEYRGSLFKCNDTDSPFFGLKCLASFHPSAVLRNYEWMPLLNFDFRRLIQEARSAELTLPVRKIDVELTCSQICARLDAIQDGAFVSVDIEGGVQQSITCVGFATSPYDAFVVNWLDFNEDEKLLIFKAVRRVLTSDRIYKILQNSLYDNFVLSWLVKTPIRGIMCDTMLSGWEIYPELPKGLGTQTSLWTREPYYKFERKISDKLTHYTYCGKDAAVTYEIAQAHQRVFATKPQAQAHYAFNMQLLPAVNYMQLRGILYDKELAKEKLAEVATQMQGLQANINLIAGTPLNVNSPKQMQDTLYRRLGYEPQYTKEHGRKTNKLTTDVEALLRLLRSDETTFIRSILQWRLLEGVRKQLMTDTDADGRVRCAYNLVGTETGRFTCYESPTGSGMNLQTVTKKLRVLYKADPGKLMFQCDLSGADGWTVAAHCRRLGDSTMFDDYMAGIKPAKVIAALKGNAKMARASQAEMREYLKTLDIPEWLYFSCKRVQHGSNYGLGKITMSAVILKDSWKIENNPLYISAADCEALQRLYLNMRYTGVKAWQRWVAKELVEKRKLGCASGHVRSFFGRTGSIDAPDIETYKAALSHEPQANTTYATSLAMHNLWHDPENYGADGKLIIEPLHQVHDALIGQFPEDKVDWAIAKIRSYFQTSITIAEQNIIIPFEGNYGTSWGELKTGII